MQTLNMSSVWKKAALVLAVAGAPVFSAQAANLFTVAPSVLGGPAAAFISPAISGTSSSRITATGATTVAGQGFIQFTAFNDPLGGALDPGVTGLNASYRLWLTYNYTATLQGGSPGFGAAQSFFNVNSLTFTVFGQQGLATTFTQASLANAAVVNVGAGVLQTLGTGSLMSGTAGLNGPLGGTPTGAFFNTSTSYLNTIFGNSFFIAPSPFYTMAFNSVTNTGPGLLIDAVNGVIAINQQVGNAEFAAVNIVPTPSSLALVGLALLAAGFIARRKSKMN